MMQRLRYQAKVTVDTGVYVYCIIKQKTASNPWLANRDHRDTC